MVMIPDVNAVANRRCREDATPTIEATVMAIQEIAIHEDVILVRLAQDVIVMSHRGIAAAHQETVMNVHHRRRLGHRMAQPPPRMVERHRRTGIIHHRTSMQIQHRTRRKGIIRDTLPPQQRTPPLQLKCIRPRRMLNIRLRAVEANNSHSQHRHRRTSRNSNQLKVVLPRFRGIPRNKAFHPPCRPHTEGIIQCHLPDTVANRMIQPLLNSCNTAQFLRENPR